jgi:hypothetical protein
VVVAVDTLGLAYMPLPKAACSSVKAALARLDPAVAAPDGPVPAETWHAIYPTRRFRPHRWQAYARHWRFCVVRDPIRRLMSCYTDRVVGRGILHHSRRLRRMHDLPADPDADFFFGHLDRYAALSSDIRHHTLGAWLFLRRPEEVFDRVYRTDELPCLAAELGRRAGRPVKLPVENASEATLRFDDLSPVTRDRLRPFLLQEYRTLSQFYENPFD